MKRCGRTTSYQNDDLAFLEPPPQAHGDAVGGAVDVDRDAQDELLGDLDGSLLRRAANHLVVLELDLAVVEAHAGGELDRLLGLERERDLEQLRAVRFDHVRHVLFEEPREIDLRHLLAVRGHPRLELHALARLERGGVVAPRRASPSRGNRGSR